MEINDIKLCVCVCVCVCVGGGWGEGVGVGWVGVLMKKNVCVIISIKKIKMKGFEFHNILMDEKLSNIFWFIAFYKNL